MTAGGDTGGFGSFLLREDPGVVSGVSNPGGAVMAHAKRAGREFGRALPSLIRDAREQGVTIEVIADGFREGLAERTPDQAEFDLWWEKYRGGQPDDTADARAGRSCAELAWLAAREGSKDAEH